jgi:uncharacterized YigZ family protein
MPESERYSTIAAPTTGEYKDRGSKFLSYAYAVRTLEEIKEHLQFLKKEHPKAVHFCYAYRLGTDGLQFRANDDGEPSGSAGKPILGQIDSFGFTNLLVVVVRYFGGTLLGVPGLIAAYKNSTHIALQLAECIEKWVEQAVTVECDYENVGEVLYVLKQTEATIFSQEMQLFCRIHAGIPVGKLVQCTKRLGEIRGVAVVQEEKVKAE